MHVAEKDEFVLPTAHATIVAMVSSNPCITLHVYSGVDHTFVRVDGEHYDKVAANGANGCTAAFFKRYLGG